MSVAALVALAHDVADHGRHLRAVRLRGDAGDRDRSAGDPRASRSTTPSWSSTRSARTPTSCGTTRQTYAEAANLAVNQTLVRSINTSHRRADPGRRDPLRRVPSQLGVGLAQGPRARAVRRHGGRRLLLDLHRHPAAGAAEVRREPRSCSPSGGPGPARRPRPTATPRCRRSPRTCRSRRDDPRGRRRRRRDPTTTGPVTPPAGPRVTPEAPGRGRTAPARAARSSQSRVGRPQRSPRRQPRSKRGKK